MKRALSILLSMILTASLFAGCTTDGSGTAAPADGDKVTITVTYATGDQVSAGLLHSTVRDYMKDNPNVTIVEKLSNEGAYLDSIRVLDAVGEFPDILEMRDTPVFVRAGKLGELPGEITDMFSTTVDFNGKIYTAPFVEGYPAGIIYNKKLFGELGIDVSDIEDYDDFLAVCETVKNAGVAPIVAGVSDIWHIGFWWNYFWHNYVAKENPNWLADRYAGKVSFQDDPNVREAMERLNELFQLGYIEEGWASTAESMAPSILISGMAAMYFIGPFAFQQIQEADPDFEFGYFAIPHIDGTINVSGGATASGWAINAETQANDPVKTEIIYDFMKYFFEKERYTNYISLVNQPPTLKEAISYEPTGQMEVAFGIAASADDKQLMWNQKLGENEMPPNFRNFAYKLCTEWFLNVSTIEEGLKTLDAEWDNVTKDFNPVKNPQ